MTAKMPRFADGLWWADVCTRATDSSYGSDASHGFNTRDEAMACLLRNASAAASAQKCAGYPDCDGDLIAEPHEPECPAAPASAPVPASELADKLRVFLVDNETCGLSRVQDACDLIREAAAAIECRGEAVAWIPVSERLPEKNTWCLVCYEGARMPKGNMSYWFDGQRFNDIGSWPVTHWQYLPRPPATHMEGGK